MATIAELIDDVDFGGLSGSHRAYADLVLSSYINSTRGQALIDQIGGGNIRVVFGQMASGYFGQTRYVDGVVEISINTGAIVNGQATGWSFNTDNGASNIYIGSRPLVAVFAHEWEHGLSYAFTGGELTVDFAHDRNPAPHQR
jgi:hypothetical protein